MGKGGERSHVSGLHANAVDVKGRIAIPARHRDLVEGEADDALVLTIDTEKRCLLIYPHPLMGRN